MATKNRKQQLAKMKRKREQKKPSYINLPKDPSQHFPSINYSLFMRGVADRDPAVWDAIIHFLAFFERFHYEAFGADAIKVFDSFLTCVFAAVMDEDFQPNNNQAIILVQMNHLLQHIVEVAGYKTTDSVLASLLSQNNNAVKLMFLQNAMCQLQIDQKKFFDSNPVIATAWYNSYGLGIGTPHPRIQENVYRHLANMDSRWVAYRPQVSSTYFTCTYHNPEAARRCKSIINSAIKKVDTGLKFTNRKSEGRPHIAIVSSRWHRNHAVYKSAGPLVEQLLDKYKLTLVWTGEKLVDTAVTSYFDKVVHCFFRPDGDFFVPEELLNNDFDMVYFPDIGMSDESIWLSNQRMAPIQAMGYGHPETTGDGSEIDYFIGGYEDKDSTDQYAETMVLIPGLGQHPAWPTYQRKYNHNDDDVVRINCVWGPDKYNYTLLSVLAEINKVALYICQEQDKKVEWEWHLFGSPGMNRYAALPPFNMYIRQLLPNAIVHSRQEYYDYMENAEQHDFALNAFPFGCYNVLVESLYLGIPFATLVGNRFYNRAGKWLNDKVSLSENSFNTPREMINWVARIITEPELLKSQQEHLANLDLKEVLFDTNNHFLQAVEYIMKNHPFKETKLIGAENG